MSDISIDCSTSVFDDLMSDDEPPMERANVRREVAPGVFLQTYHVMEGLMNPAYGDYVKIRLQRDLFGEWEDIYACLGFNRAIPVAVEKAVKRMKSGEKGIVSASNVLELRKEDVSSISDIDRSVPFATLARKLAKLRRNERAALKRNPAIPDICLPSFNPSFVEPVSTCENDATSCEESFSNCVKVHLIRFERVCSLNDAGTLAKHIIHEGTGVRYAREGDLILLRMISTQQELSCTDEKTQMEFLEQFNQSHANQCMSSKEVWLTLSRCAGLSDDLISVISSMKVFEVSRIVIRKKGSDEILNDCFIQLLDIRAHKVLTIKDYRNELRSSDFPNQPNCVRLDCITSREGPTSLLEASPGCLVVATLKLWTVVVNQKENSFESREAEISEGEKKLGEKPVDSLDWMEQLVRAASKRFRSTELSNKQNSRGGVYLEGEDDETLNLEVRFPVEDESENATSKHDEKKHEQTTSVKLVHLPLFEKKNHNENAHQRRTFGWIQGSGMVPSPIEQIVTSHLRTGQRSFFALPLSVFKTQPCLFSQKTDFPSSKEKETCIAISPALTSHGVPPERWSGILQEPLVELATMRGGVATEIFWNEHLRSLDLSSLSLEGKAEEQFVLLDVTLEGVVWQVTETYNLNESQRLTRGQYHRSLGNEWFRIGMFLKAVEEYEKAFECMRFSIAFSLFGVTENMSSETPGHKFVAPPIDDEEEGLMKNTEHVEKVRELACVLCLNKSTVQLKMRRFRDAVSSAEMGIKISPSNLKAFYRLAQAYLAMDDAAKAISACDRGLEIVAARKCSEGDQGASVEEVSLVNLKKEAVANQKKHQDRARAMFGGLFASQKKD